jgi:hypothetical protein
MSAETKYRCFTDHTLRDVWAKYHHHEDIDLVEVLRQIDFKRWSAVSHELQRQSLLTGILGENGIVINTDRSPAPPGFDMYDDWIRKHPDGKPFTFGPEDKISKDGAFYKSFLMPDEVKDWGFILKKTDESVELIVEGRFENITAKLAGLAEDNQIDFKYIHKQRAEMQANFKPQPEDF